MPWVTANICQVLEAGVAAGMLFHDALDLAAPACGNRVIAERLRKAGGDLRHGRIERLTVALRQVALPTVVVQLIDGGEVSGKLEDSLMRAASFQRETFESRSLWSAKVLAGICFMAALLTAAYTIISMYAAYLNTALQMLDDT
jgi:type II secretory pathway component PulF